MPQLRLERGGVAGEAGKLKPGPGRSAQEVADHQLGRIHAATVELVAERGYDAVAVRELTRRAGVSSRSFYKHYAGKEECLLAVHLLVASRTLRRLSEAQAEARDPMGAIRCAVVRTASDWAAAPDDAHLLLVAPYHAGKRAIDQLRQTEAIFRTRLERSIASMDPGVVASSLAAQAIIDGLVSVGSAQLLNGAESELANQASQLAEWACGLADPATGKLEDFGRDRWGGGWGAQSTSVSDFPGVEGSVQSNSDVSLLLAAVTKLVARNPDKAPTLDEIVAVAGLPRTAFSANFPDVESCVATALDSKLENAIKSARRTVQREDAPTERAYRAVDALCNHIVSDPELNSFCRADAVSSMLSIRLRFQSLLAVELRHPLIEVNRGANVTELSARASAGALWGLLRHHPSGHSAEEGARDLAALLTYLMLASGTVGSKAIGVIEQGQAFSAA